MPSDPLLTVLLFATLSAAAAGLGVLPLAGRREVPRRWLGWANATAAGLMLGAAFMLSETRLPGSPLPMALGAAVGILFIHTTHRWVGAGGGAAPSERAADPAWGFKVQLLGALHGASEGVAIGVAMRVDLDFGIFLALAIAVHNVPEATVLAGLLRARGVALGEAAGLAVVANVGQVLLAVTVFALLGAAPQALAWVLGFAIGALIHLCLVELLPESYRQAGVTPIALVTVTAMGGVVLVERLLG